MDQFLYYETDQIDCIYFLTNTLNVTNYPLTAFKKKDQRAKGKSNHQFQKASTNPDQKFP